MKAKFVKLVLGMGLIGALSPAFGQERIATVKLQKAFSMYWKSLQLKQLLEYKGKELELEMADLEKQRQRGLAEFQKARQAIESPALSESARRAKAKEAGDIRQSVLVIERKMQQKKREFARFSQAEQSRILKELATLVQNYAAKKGYSLVFDNSQPVPVLFARPEYDITEAFVAEINKGHEDKTSSKPEKETPVKPEPKKGMKVPGRGVIPDLAPPAKKED